MMELKHNTLDVSDVSDYSIHSIFDEYHDYFTDALESAGIEYYLHSEPDADTGIIIVKPENKGFMDDLIAKFNAEHDVRDAEEDPRVYDDLKAYARMLREKEQDEDDDEGDYDADGFSEETIGQYGMERLEALMENTHLYRVMKADGTLEEHLKRAQRSCVDMIENAVKMASDRLREQNVDIVTFDNEIKRIRRETESLARRTYVNIPGGGLYEMSLEEYNNAEIAFMEEILSYVTFIYDYKDAIYHECDNDLKYNSFCIDDLPEGFYGYKYDKPLYYMDNSTPEDRKALIDEIFEQADKTMISNYIAQLAKHGSREMVQELAEAVKATNDIDFIYECANSLMFLFRGTHTLC